MKIVGDIGGTNVRLGALSEDGALLFSTIETFEATKFGSFDEVFETFMKKFPNDPVTHLALGVAGAVENNAVNLLNSPWIVVGDKLVAKFSLEKAVIVNDLLALAHSIEALNADQLVCIKTGQDKPGNRAVIAAGTGLGQSLIAFHQGKYIPLSSEGGHCSFSPVQDEDVELLSFLKQTHNHVSAERVISGKFGFKNILDFHCAKIKGFLPGPWAELLAGVEEPGAIIADARKKGEAFAKIITDHFVRLYASEVGNLCLKGLALGGVYLGGGVTEKMREQLDSEIFIEAFTNKGRYRKLLSTVPVYVITEPYAPLLGASQLIK